MNKTKLRLYLLAKLPLAFIAGLRMGHMDSKSCTVKVKHRWINQNPFNSMYFAAQVMAAELSTALLLMNAIKKSEKSISMLVVRQESYFYKKATGKLEFKCADFEKIQSGIKEALENEEGSKILLQSKAYDSDQNTVSSFDIEWSVKVRSGKSKRAN